MSSSIKILVADDEPIGRQLLEAILMPEGFDIIFGCDGQEALDAALKEIPDFILLDVMMPKMDGFEVCKKIRDNKSTSQIPIFLITALDDRDSRIRGIDAGADDYISKPFDRVEILAKIKNSTSRIQQRKTSPIVEEIKPSNGEPLEYEPKLLQAFLQVILTPNNIPDGFIQARTISGAISNHCFFTENTYSLYLSNQLKNSNALLANALFSSIWKTVIKKNHAALNEILRLCIQELNEIIKEHNLELLKNANFSIAITQRNNEIKEVRACGINSNIYVKSEELQIGLSGSSGFQSYYLQGNQDLSFKNADSLLFLSPNILEILNQQELNSFVNNKLLTATKENFEDIVLTKFGKEIDIYGVKLTFQ